MSTAPQQPTLWGLLDRGDEFARSGDEKAAMSFYQAAIKGARGPLPDPRTAQRLRMAQAFIQRRVDEFQRSLDRAAADFRPTEAIAQTRLNHSLDMLKGERTIYPQQPAVFYYPYLAQRQFFESGEFEWAARLEAATSDIREELVALLGEGADFRPYVEDKPNRPAKQFHHLNNDPSWTALYLWRDGKLVTEIADRCPRTLEALSQVPLSHIGERTPSV
ncbi:MAG TPA: aspartyl/asparaginyl beta-hydroxylase domain-containing protein, partial [Sphingomicrobium sp.]|nr:aspartyl/asparaginyl beta-hydroxylase domain-containing protein [Sphingomicrobium sp.]